MTLTNMEMQDAFDKLVEGIETRVTFGDDDEIFSQSEELVARLNETNASFVCTDPQRFTLEVFVERRLVNAKAQSKVRNLLHLIRTRNLVVQPASRTT